MNLPGIEVATLFQQTFEPPVGSREEGSWRGTSRDSQEAIADASRSSSSCVHGTIRGRAEGISVRKTEKEGNGEGWFWALFENDN